MDDRLKIPALALLGLSFTDCTDDPPPANPIVGEWQAISVDGQKFPVVETMGPYSLVYGYELSVEDDLAGEFLFYYEYGYDGLHSRAEQGSDLVVDDAMAPKYRIDVAVDPVPDIEPPYYDTGYVDTGYADGGDYGTTGNGAADHVPLARPIVLPGAPDRAPAELVMSCTLDADTLSCAREGADKPQKWVFKRKPKDSPDGA